MPNPSEQVLSFLTPEEVQALGGLPPEAIAGVLESGHMTPEAFRPNRVFIEFMHLTIREAGPLNPGLQAAARKQGEGWVYVVDLRTGHTQGGQVPPQDIIGGFQVHAGRILGPSYQRNDDHRIFTTDGLVQLPAGMRAMFVASLQAHPGGNLPS